MEIRLNGEQRSVDGDASLADLVNSLELAGRRIAVEVNETIVPRGEHAGYRLKDGDKVEIVHAIGGG